VYRRFAFPIIILICGLMLPNLALRAAEKSAKNTSSSNIITEGEWIGYLRKFKSDTVCKANFGLVSASVKSNRLEIKFAVDTVPASVSGKISPARKFAEWANFDIRMQDSYDTARATGKFQGTFRGQIFDGYFNAGGRVP